MAPLVHVVLHEPEIPQNTGSIGRACVGFGARLHLIHPLGFDLGEKALRRAGLDYWPRLDLREHASYAAYESAEQPGRVWLLTASRGAPIFGADLAPGDHVVLGRESAGLPAWLIERHAGRCLTIPMRRGERSLNLSVAAGIAMAEVLRRAIGLGAVGLDDRGRIGAWNLGGDSIAR